MARQPISPRNDQRPSVRKSLRPGPSTCERMTGIEPALSAWEADVLPLNYIRRSRQRPSPDGCQGFPCLDIVPEPAACRGDPRRGYAGTSPSRLDRGPPGPARGLRAAAAIHTQLAAEGSRTIGMREPAILIGGHVISAYLARPLPLCTSARFPAAPRRKKRSDPGQQPLRCRPVSSAGKDKPWKHRWAGAATPTQRNTTRPQESPRRASDVFYVSNPHRKDNPRWTISNATETTRVPSRGSPLLM
jgi:hypothetical protein